MSDEMGPATTKDKSEALANKWIREIQRALDSKEYKEFLTVGDKIIKVYRNSSPYEANAGRNPSRVMYNILWANVQVLKPTLYARLPKVVVERRHKDMDPVGRLAAQIAERATSYMISTQQDSFSFAVKSAVEDRLLPGRGVNWLRYDADFEVIEKDPSDDDIDEVEEEGEEASEKVVKPNSEKVCVDYVFWKDYLESAARTPYEVRWKARRSFLSKAKFKERFGEDIAKCCEAAVKESEDQDMMNERRSYGAQFEVWEIWDRETKKVYWVSLEYSDACLDIKDDPLRLDTFFPCPFPLLATTTTDSQMPVADYRIYERLAEELDYTNKRIAAMVECVRLVGATAASFNTDIKNMMSLSDGQLWPIEQWNSYVERGGLKGVVDWLPFDQCVAAIPVLQQRQEQLIAQIWEVTGIPDIARGSSDPTETAAAQQQKSQWVSIKVSEKQADVQRFCRELISKMAEITFEPGLFSDETIYLMAGIAQMSQEDQQNAPAALGLLRDDRLRTFRVDIETDSTIAIDEAGDKAARMEYIQALSGLFSGIQGVAQFRPELLNPMLESAMFATRAFRAGRSVEGAWDMAIQTIQDNDKAAAENPQPPAQDPAIIQAQAYAQDIQAKNELKQMEMQNHAMEMQATQQVDMQKLNFQGQELQQRAQEAQMRYEIDMQKLQLEQAKIMSKQEMDALTHQLDEFKAQFQAQLEQHRVEIEQYNVVLSQREKMVEEARLNQQELIDAIKISEKAESPAPAIHIHNGSGSKEILLQRAPDGSLIGRSTSVEG